MSDYSLQWTIIDAKLKLLEEDADLLEEKYRRKNPLVSDEAVERYLDKKLTKRADELISDQVHLARNF